jgi:hypothetical protein
MPSPAPQEATAYGPFSTTDRGRVARGVRLPSHARMRALLVDDLDDDGYDDLVVSHPSARCEYVPSERYCIPLGWLAVYRGSVGGLDAHPPWVYAPGDLSRGPGLGLAAVRSAPTGVGAHASVDRHLRLVAHPRARRRVGGDGALRCAVPHTAALRGADARRSERDDPSRRRLVSANGRREHRAAPRRCDAPCRLARVRSPRCARGEAAASRRRRRVVRGGSPTPGVLP